MLMTSSSTSVESPSPASVVVRAPTLPVALAVPTVLILFAAVGWPLESK